ARVVVAELGQVVGELRVVDAHARLRGALCAVLALSQVALGADVAGRAGGACGRRARLVRPEGGERTGCRDGECDENQEKGARAPERLSQGCTPLNERNPRKGERARPGILSRRGVSRRRRTLQSSRASGPAAARAA